MKTWKTFAAAFAWAKVYAKEHCHAYHGWKVVKTAAGEFAVAVFSKNTGVVEAYAS
jgi:hypothetical protein